MADTKSQDLQRMILQRLLYYREQTNRQLAKYVQDRLRSHIKNDRSFEFRYETYEESYVENIQKIVHDVSNQTKELVAQKIFKRESSEVQEPYKDSVRKITRLTYHIPISVPCSKRLFEKFDVYHKEDLIWDVVLLLNSPYLKEIVPKLVCRLLSEAVSLFYYRVEPPPFTEVEIRKIQLLTRMSFTNLKRIFSSFRVSEDEEISIMNPPIIQPASRLWDFQEKLVTDKKLKRSEIQEQFDDVPKSEIAAMLKEDGECFRKQISNYIHNLLVNVRADQSRLFRDLMESLEYRLLPSYFGEDICNEFEELFKSREVTFTAYLRIGGPNPQIPSSEWKNNSIDSSDID